MKNKIFNFYVDFICKKCNITRQQLFLKTKQRQYSLPRFMLYYICSKRPIGSTEISNLMKQNGLDVPRQNIDCGIDKIKNIKDKDIWEIINSCIITFKNQ